MLVGKEWIPIGTRERQTNVMDSIFGRNSARQRTRRRVSSWPNLIDRRREDRQLSGGKAQKQSGHRRRTVRKRTPRDACSRPNTVTCELSVSSAITIYDALSKVDLRHTRRPLLPPPSPSPSPSHSPSSQSHPPLPHPSRSHSRSHCRWPYPHRHSPSR